jgi:hypothetical protein
MPVGHQTLQKPATSSILLYSVSATHNESSRPYSPQVNNTNPHDLTLPISPAPSFPSCLFAHLSANHVTIVSTMLAPNIKNTTSVPYNANLLSWQSDLKLLLLSELGTTMSCGIAPLFLYRHVQVWMVSRPGVLPLRMCAQTRVMRLRRREGRMVRREMRARRVYFWRRESCEH